MANRNRYHADGPDARAAREIVERLTPEPTRANIFDSIVDIADDLDGNGGVFDAIERIRDIAAHASVATDRTIGRRHDSGRGMCVCDACTLLYPTDDREA